MEVGIARITTAAFRHLTLHGCTLGLVAEFQVDSYLFRLHALAARTKRTAKQGKRQP